jgi:hypothetical protein
MAQNLGKHWKKCKVEFNGAVIVKENLKTFQKSYHIMLQFTPENQDPEEDIKKVQMKSAIRKAITWLNTYRHKNSGDPFKQVIALL